MMYESKMAAAIKVKGKVLREFKDTVYVPFGSEYSILLKNLHTTRAVVNVFIDGDNMVPGGIILNAGQEVDLERSIKNGNLNEGNKFKFIERSGAVEQHRGIELEDGLVKVEFQFEQPSRPITWTSTPSWGGVYASGASGSSYNVNGVMRSVDFSAGEAMKASATSATDATLKSMNISNTSQVHDGMATMDWMPANDVGITVPGSKSEQKFVTAHVGVLETTKHSMVFRILGDNGQTKVTKPVTVAHKPKCVTCGKQNKAHAKFCQECGTALEIFA
jgi:hypothetical protein